MCSTTMRYAKLDNIILRQANLNLAVLTYLLHIYHTLDTISTIRHNGKLC